MQLKREIGRIRQAIVWAFAKNVGLSRDNRIDLIFPAEIKRILISRPNHRLGNTLLITPLLLDVMATFPRARIDLFVKGKVAPIVFRNYENVERTTNLPARPFIHPFVYLYGWIRLKWLRYDLAINAVHHSSSGRLSTRFANATYRCYGDPDQAAGKDRPDHTHAASLPVYAFRDYLSRRGVSPRTEPVPPLDLRLSESEIAWGQRVLLSLVPAGRKTICLFTYATGAKMYGRSWWNDFFARLNMEYSHFNFIEILPLENSSQLPVAIPSFYSTDIREIGSVIAGTDLFIGADSGMMHLASAVGVDTIGLFKVTDPAAFGPYHNNSMSIDTNAGNIDDWMAIVDSVMRSRRMSLELPRKAGSYPGGQRH